MLNKHGVEIYEGDIVKEDGYIGYICYNNEECCYAAYKDEIEEAWMSVNMEVIGNIYENSELLHVKE